MKNAVVEVPTNTKIEEKMRTNETVITGTIKSSLIENV